MKAITFLGTGRYDPTTYVFGERECTTALFPVALCDFFAPSELVVLVTRAAREKHLASLQNGLPSGVPCTPVDIPDGHSEADLWEIFSRMTAHIAEGEEVVFDITHSFRSLPFLAFLAVSYLRVAKQAQLAGVLYGAFEARELETNRTPVFDLTPFVGLLDWTAATNSYLQTGDARGLADLLENRNLQLYRSVTPGAETALPRHLQKLGGQLQKVSQAVELTRPLEALPEAAKLLKYLEAAEAEVAAYAQPFGVLLRRIEADAGRYAVTKDGAMAEQLAAQYRLLLWYLEKGQALQAATLAREWVISVLCWRWGLDWLDLDDREKKASAALKGYERELRSKKAEEPAEEAEESRLVEPPAYLEDLKQMPEAEVLGHLWSRIVQLRNDLNHAGMNSKAMEASRLFDKIQGSRESLEAVARAFGLA